MTSGSSQGLGGNTALRQFVLNAHNAGLSDQDIATKLKQVEDKETTGVSAKDAFEAVFGKNSSYVKELENNPDLLGQLAHLTDEDVSIANIDALLQNQGTTTQS